MLSKDSYEKRVIHSKSDNIDIMIGRETDKVILFESFLSKYQIGLEESVRSTNFAFDFVKLQMS